MTPTQVIVRTQPGAISKVLSVPSSVSDECCINISKHVDDYRNSRIEMVFLDENGEEVGGFCKSLKRIQCKSGIVKEKESRWYIAAFL